jgi:hypothetical protein
MAFSVEATTAEEERLNIRRNPYTSFVAASDCRTIYDYTASLPFALLAHQLHQMPRFVDEE